MCDDCSDSTSTPDTSSDTSSDTSCDTSTDTTAELPEDTGDLSYDGAEELPDDGGDDLECEGDDLDCENEEADDCSEEVLDDETESAESADIEEENPDIDEADNQDSIGESVEDIEDNSLDGTTENDLPESEIEKSADDDLYADGSEELPDGEECVTTEDLKSAKDLVDAEEYDKYKDFYDFTDNLDISPEYRDKLLDCYKNASPDMKQMYNEYAPDLKCNDSNYTTKDKYGNDVPDAYFNAKEKGFKFNQNFDATNELGYCNDFFHESGHMIDWLKRDNGFLGFNQKNYSEKNDFTGAIENDYNNAINSFKEQEIDKYLSIERDAGFNTSREKVAEMYKDDIEQNATDRMREMLWEGDNKTSMSTISDVFGGTTYYSSGSQVRGAYGHSDSYWKNRDPSIVGKEAYAGISAAYMTNNQVAIDKLNAWMPETMNLYRQQLINKRS